MAATSECLAKLGALKVSHVTGKTSDGRDFDFYSVDRSYKDDKDEWQNQSITLKPAELFALGSLLKLAGEDLAKKQAIEHNSRKENGGVPF